LIEKNMMVHILRPDAALRGIDPTAVPDSFKTGDYADLVELLEESDRVIGTL